MKTMVAACCATLICAVSWAQTPSKTALPPQDPALKDHVPSFSTKRRTAVPFQPSTATPTAPRTAKPAPKAAVPAPSAPRGMMAPKPPAARSVALPPPVATPATTPAVPPASNATPPVAPPPATSSTPSPSPSAPAAQSETPTSPPDPSSPADAAAPTEGDEVAPAAPRARSVAAPPAAPGQPRRVAPTGKLAEYHLQYREFFRDNAFTDELAGYWQEAFAAEPERAAEIVQESAVFAAEAIAAGLADEPMAHASIANGLAWLESLYAQVDEVGWKQVGDAIGVAFSESPARLAEALEGRRDPESARSAMQACLTLALYGDATALQAWCTLSERGRSFMADAQAFLFGGEALSDDQYASLVSLFAAVPRDVHQVLAVVVPEGIQLDSAQAALRTPGLVLNIYASANGLSSPDEFFPELGTQPVAPLFTLEAAAQLVRAAQYVQFGLRPELAERRDLILRNAGYEPTRYLRRSVPPGAYLAEPDELLPQTAYLWFIDSATAFEQAGGLLRFKENEPMDALLLLADTLSGGGDETLEFRTELNGRVSSRVVPLQRTQISPGVAFASGIVIGGEAWTFGFERDGGVTRESAPVGVVEAYPEVPLP